MIPPVLLNLRTLAELASHGMELDFERLHLSGVSPITDALAARVPFGNLGAETFVIHENGPKQRARGVIQARVRKNRPEADITFIAPALPYDADAVTIWYRLLAGATRGLGGLGCQRLYAAVPAENGAEEVFRQAGFVSFTREQIFFLAAPNARAAAHTNGIASGLTMRRMRKRDAWNVWRLYTAITPRPVQSAEARLTSDDAPKLDDWWENLGGTNYLLERDETLLGLVRISRGRLATWVRFHLTPQTAAVLDQIVQETIALIAQTRTRPIYVAVRDYEGGLAAALAAVGFTPRLERSHMVKHTTVRVRETATWMKPVLETSKIPVIHTTQHAREK